MTWMGYSHKETDQRHPQSIALKAKGFKTESKSYQVRHSGSNARGGISRRPHERRTPSPHITDKLPRRIIVLVATPSTALSTLNTALRMACPAAGSNSCFIQYYDSARMFMRHWLDPIQQWIGSPSAN